MPTVQAPALVLVTGGSGYIGAWVVRYLVERGYTVRAALRSEAKGQDLITKFPGKVEIAVVPVIEAEGAYDEAVKGVDAVIHLASPVIFAWEDPQEVIRPAIDGTLGLLKSAAKVRSIKRVVITSSGYAVNFTPSEEDGPGTVYTEEDWDVQTPAHVKKEGRNSNPVAVYSASKTLAEQAAWEWAKTTKPHFDQTVIIPVFNWGPWDHPVTDKTKIGSTPEVFLSQVSANGGPTPGVRMGGFVDVRDTALAHILAIETEAAGGERILSTNHDYAFQDLFDILNEAGFENIPKGEPGSGKNKIDIHFSNEKLLRIFPQLKLRDLKTSVIDMATQMRSLGWLTPIKA